MSEYLENTVVVSELFPSIRHCSNASITGTPSPRRWIGWPTLPTGATVRVHETVESAVIGLIEGGRNEATTPAA